MRLSWPMHRSSAAAAASRWNMMFTFMHGLIPKWFYLGLSSHPRNWKPYIANRTSEILDLVPADSWRYVPTKMNPADIACRGFYHLKNFHMCSMVGRPSMAFLCDGLLA
ncbi:hypothetical protein TNCV_2023291 [Trichonephila clavipes]|nr:hypothetical protein TNCV_2023291 [Trichonephila clavipes]